MTWLQCTRYGWSCAVCRALPQAFVVYFDTRDGISSCIGFYALKQKKNRNILCIISLFFFQIKKSPVEKWILKWEFVGIIDLLINAVQLPAVCWEHSNWIRGISQHCTSIHIDVISKAIDDHAVDMVKYVTLTTICIHFMHTLHSNSIFILYTNLMKRCTLRYDDVTTANISKIVNFQLDSNVNDIKASCKW